MSKMDMQNYYTLSGLMFAFAFLLHGTRVLNNWDIFIGSFSLPIWVSYVVGLAALYLAYQSFQLRK